VPDKGDGTYRNPVLFADYSDPDVIRVGNDFYLTASSFNCVPGLPVLHSKDLVNWTILGHVFRKYPVQGYGTPHHGGGVWAPSLRYRDDEFCVYFGDPDLGIFLSKAGNPAGPWEPLHLVREAKGWIDPCPFWDDDGNAYLVHAWAKSRSGIKNILTIHRMSPDGRTLLDDGTTIFDGTASHPTIEGPKLYKRNGWYYIFAPAGGVSDGWQTVLRSTNPFGPYEDKIVLAQGETEINGPHQGAWVDTNSGESWFLHFQDRGAYGRIVHLQPLQWVDDWPVIGTDEDGDGRGEPVLFYKKPEVGSSSPLTVPQTSDEFDADKLGLQWQWQANYEEDWYSLTARPGWLRLFSVPVPGKAVNLWPAPNLLLQKLPGPEFTVSAKLDFSNLAMGERVGLIMMGMDYSYIAVERAADGFRLIKAACADANKAGEEIVEDEATRLGHFAILRIKVKPGAVCAFSYSNDGKKFSALGESFPAREGDWIGAKVGLFCLASDEARQSGHADFDWFRFE
jgi:beta-xylosidase